MNVRVTPEHLGAFATSLFVSRGMGEGHAATCAASLVWANLRGIDSHGVSRLPWYFDLMDKGEIDPLAIPTIRLSAPAFFILDAHRGAGPVALSIALREAIGRSRLSGVCVALIAGTTHTGAIGRFAEEAAEQGCVAMIIGSGSQTMAYHGAKVAGVSTCPIAIGAEGEGAPLVADIATSVASMGRIQQAKERGGEIPQGWALSAAGEVTTDALKAALPLPLGGHKGSDLAFMFEMMTGVLAGYPSLAPMLDGSRPRQHLQNTFLLVMNVASFRERDAYRQDADALVKAIKGLPRREGVDELFVPGEWGRRREGERHDGILVPDAVWNSLTQLANRAGIAPPESIPS
jgi:ureidoglycolate dehydrogenase (NAD+)